MVSKTDSFTTNTQGSPSPSDVAIVGIGCRFPDADHYDQYWDNMISHVNSVRKISRKRWETGRFGLKNEADLGWENGQFVKYCASLNDLDKFDHSFFNLSPREVTSMDPQQRMLLEETWHCLEDSGIPLEELQRMGTSVYVGVTGNDYSLAALTGGEHVDHYAGLGNFECIAANRISYFLGLHGESLSLDTACSSSLVAVHKARQNLQSGEAKYAIAAGVCLSYHPWRYVTFSKSNMMSRDGQCKAFDENADGFVQGEGVGVLLLQRLEDAIAEGSHIYGVIRGSAVNHCGASQTIAAPSMKAQMDVVETALRQAGLSAATVNYIEAHGTGTALGDPIEVEALTRVFSQYTNEKQFCTIGSVKTNIGHLASAAGMAGLIRVLLMMKHKKIPAMLNLSSLNPLLDWEYTPFRVATANADWRPVNEHTPLRAGVSGFGFGGVNAHVILESYGHESLKRSKQAEESHIFALSALNGNSLRNQIEAWKMHVHSPEVTDETIGDICKTLLSGRRHCTEHRIGAVVRGKADIEALLASATAGQGIGRAQTDLQLQLTNTVYRGYSNIKPLMEQAYISQYFEDALSAVEAAGKSKPRSGIRFYRWKKDRAAAYSFIVNYALTKALIGLGVPISLVGGEHQGELLALAISGMITPAEAYAALIGEEAVDHWNLRRPELSYIGSNVPVPINRLNIGTEYPARLREQQVEDCDSDSLRHYTQKARILSKTQFTFKKYLKDWDQALAPWGLTAEALLNDEELLTGGAPLLEKRRILLLLVAYGSLLKLNRKWDLTDRVGIRNDWLNELIQLVADEVLTREMATSLLLSEDGALEAVCGQINERQGLLHADSPYSHLYDASDHLAEILDLHVWKAQLKEQLRERGTLQTQVIRITHSGIEQASLSPSSGGLYGLNALLVKLWIAGADINWNLLYPSGSYRKRPLPGYSFERTQHWVQLRESTGAVGPGGLEIPTVSAMRTAHPMLDLDKSSPESGLFVKTLKRSDFYVGDHIVDNRVILPGVAYLELARAAGELAAGQPVKTIRDVMWVNRMEIEDICDAYIQIYHEAEFMRFQVYTLLNGVKIRHCQGKLSIADSGNRRPAAMDIAGIQARCAARISKAFCYKDVFENFIGFRYGSGFQATTEAFGGEGESLEKLDLPLHLVESFNDYELHPSIVDAALRAVTWVGGMEAYKQLRLHIPFALGEFKIYGRLTPSCYSYARLDPESAGKKAGMKRFQIFILNEQGEVLAEARDFTIRAIQPKPPILEASQVHLYTESWVETKVRKVEGGAVHVLYFGKDNGNAGKLAKALEKEQGKAARQILFVQQGPAYEFDSGGSEYMLNTARPEDYLRLFEELGNQGLRIDSIVYEWDKPEIVDEFCSIYYLFQAASQVNPKQLVRFVFVSAGSGVQVGAGMLKGLCKAFQSLYRMVQPSIVYVDDPEELPRLAAKELFANKTAYCPVVAYRKGVRSLKIIHTLEGLPLRSEGSNGFRSGGTYLITGGMGRIGLAVAEFVLAKYSANVVLVGRSALDDNRRRQLERLESLPGQVIYLDADLSDLKAGDTIVKQAKKIFGVINGVIHCAGVLGVKTLSEAVPGELPEVLLPKIHGAVGLDEATRNEKLDFFILFSSISAIIGDFGRGSYAAANSFMDQFAEWRAERVLAGERYGASLSINWPVWSEGSMQLSPVEEVQYRKQAGLERLETSTGLKLLERLAGTPLTRAIVTCGDAQVINRMMDVKEGALAREGGRGLPEFNAGVADAAHHNDRNGQKERVLNASSQRVNHAALEQTIENYLKDVVSKATGISPSQLQTDANFSKYGIDSIMIMDLNSILERDFSDLPSTLFFEYNTIGQLAGFFKEHHEEYFQTVQTDLCVLPEAKSSSAGIPAASKDIWGNSTTELVPNEALSSEPGERKHFIDEDLEPLERSSRCDIAIVGMSGQYPMADTLDEFWEILSQGKDCVTEIPAERWDYRKDFDPEKGKSNKVYTKWGAFMNDVDKFDAGFFHISPREAELMDPQERLMLQSTYHTLEDAGYAGGKVSGKKVGVFVGVMNSHYQMLGAEQYANGQLLDVRSSFASIANRISYYFNFKGPSIAVDTMCSSALVAIHMACESIRHGESELAVAGSVNTVVHPAKYIFLSDQRFGSTEGKCRAFGQGGDGYVPGEGVGAVLLKPLEAARRDGDQIYGVIKGSAINHGGKVSSYTVPNPNAQAELIEEALIKSGVHPEVINYIEAHGTGTALGDPIEIAGLTKAFKKTTSKTGYCAIGSVKSNIGHLESAAGMASLTKVLLQMKHKLLVPSILAEKLNDNIDFEKTPFFVQRSLQPWEPIIEEAPSGMVVHPLTAGISSFGAGGTNAHLILESYEPEERTPETEREQLVVLSAKTPDKLREQALKLAEYIGLHREGGNQHAASVDEYASVLEDTLWSQTDIYDKCVQVIAEVLGVNPELIDWDEDLSSLSADAVHRVAIATQLREIFQGNYDEEAFWNSRTLRELMNRYAEVGRKRRNPASPDTENYTLRLEDIAYTLQTGREMFDERTAFVCRSIAGLRDMLIRFGTGERNMTDVYTSVPGTQREMTSILFHNDTGSQFIDRILSSRNLPQIAQLWLLKVDIPWKQLHEGSAPSLISLPNYSFSKKSYWIGKGYMTQAAEQYGSESAGIDIASERLETIMDLIAVSDDAPEGLPQEVVPPESSKVEQMIEECLFRTLGEVIYTEAEGINDDIPFSELGINSVLTLELVDKLNHRLGIALHSNDLFNFNTARLLVEHILETYSTRIGLARHNEVDLNPEAALETLNPVEIGNHALTNVKINLNELELLLEES
ncbi:SDR family NAD(P)-dependent oxidoreductase [Paenibacillus lutimineralis]|uniref:SDR family NAD(P)-dependent oxidoreductase n=1 Tax=Paenibacillus lutimineralis TaxID=2707005 RepID=A0A3S9UV29_9BACL|nr:SDR family NAD(P)-dependent oxidoreductase [Paenibacillus lutimineralis]AZS14154.1 SDR family NAD(P)-dependent oxidoreductase [Paenibacillus lutimineralis]